MTPKPTPKEVIKEPVKDKHRTLWDKIWKDKSGTIVIAQSPNIWILLWIFFEAINLVIKSGSISHISQRLSVLFLGIWAVLELTQGVNYFRKFLGLIFTLSSVLALINLGF